MKRLGYSKFVAQGGDWGAVVVDYMGLHVWANLPSGSLPWDRIEVRIKGLGVARPIHDHRTVETFPNDPRPLS